MNRFRIVLLIHFVVLVSDQISKIWARKYLIMGEAHTYLGGFVNIEFAENPGAFLSFGAEMGETARFWIFTVLVFGVLLWAAWVLWKKEDLHRLEVWGLSLLLSGGIGNLIDRATKGTVTDFVQVGWSQLRTGIFNIADMAILLGVVLLMFVPKKEKKVS